MTRILQDVSLLIAYERHENLAGDVIGSKTLCNLAHYSLLIVLSKVVSFAGVKSISGEMFTTW